MLLYFKHILERRYEVRVGKYPHNQVGPTSYKNNANDNLSVNRRPSYQKALFAEGRTTAIIF